MHICIYINGYLCGCMPVSRVECVYKPVYIGKSKEGCGDGWGGVGAVGIWRGTCVGRWN